MSRHEFARVSELVQILRRSGVGNARRGRRTWRPTLEGLEARRLLATYNVTSTSDTLGTLTLVNKAMQIYDDTSLRGAILASDASNATAKNPNTILFTIPQKDPNYSKATGTWTILVGSSNDKAAQQALPPITKPVTINGFKPGTTQPTIQLDGQFIFNNPKTPQTYTNGLTLAPGSGGSVVSGLIINRFTAGAGPTFGNGILVLSAGNSIVGNFIGTDVTGNIDVGPNKQALGNGNDGVLINGAASNTVGNPPGQGTSPSNVIAGNAGNGVEITGKGATGNKVFGGHIGVNARGDTAVPNGGNGVQIGGGASGNSIGTAPGANGQPAGAYNTIAGNKGNGVLITGGASGNQVGNNLIGVQDKANGTALPNGLNGVLINGGATGNLIGGKTAAQGNTISGNTRSGVCIDGTADTAKTGVTGGNMVQGNSIGLAFAGNGAVANHLDGVQIVNSPLNMIGGSVAQTGTAPGNIISGNAFAGVSIEDVKSIGNRVQGNFIGTNKAGTAALGNNSDGVAIVDGPTLTQVGGTTGQEPPTNGNKSPAQGNLISGNGGDGVHIYNLLANVAAPSSNFIEGNLIGTDKNGKDGKMGNAGDGITLGSAGKAASRNQVGPSPGMVGQQANGVIAYNKGIGVNIVAGRLNSILDTSIYSNKANIAGIVLNQAAKSNDLIAAPILTRVAVVNGTTIIQGTAPGQANGTQMILEVFDQAQGGGGAPVMGGVFQTSVSITIGNNGKFQTPALNKVFTGNITTTVTDPNNNTSPFSDVATPAKVGALLPQANNDQYATAENMPLTVATAAGVLSNDTDPNGLSLTAVLDTKPADGQLTFNPNGSFTYTPDTDFFGTDHFTYSADDGLGESTPATVTLTVTEVNQPPVANPVVVSTTENTPLSFPASNLLVNDTPGPPDESGQTLTVTSVGDPVGGTVALSGGTVTFTPALNFTGAAGFDYTIEDNGTTDGQPDPLSATSTVTVNVAPPSSVMTSTTVVGVPNPSVSGQPVSFTATVTPASPADGPPTGTVQFVINGTDFGSPVPLTVNASTAAITADALAVGTGTGTGTGTATSESIDTLAAGTYTITALYSGDAQHAASTGTVTQTVNQAATSTTVSSSAPASVLGQSVTLTAQVTPVSPGAGTPTGMVAFKSSSPGGTSVTLGTAPLGPNGTAVFSTDQLTPAGYTIDAVYLGDANNAPSTSAPITQAVGPAATTIALTATESETVSGEANDFNLSLAVVPPGAPIVAPTGTITVYDTFDGTTTALVTLTIGQSGQSPALTAVGSHVLTAVYSGDDDYQGSTSAPLTVVVTTAS